MTNIELILSPYQARLVKAALSAEVRKGSGTFLDYDDVLNLGAIARSIDSQILAQPVREAA